MSLPGQDRRQVSPVLLQLSEFTSWMSYTAFDFYFIVLVLARTILIFAVVMRGNGQNPEVILYDLTLSEAGERECVLRRMGSCQEGEAGRL